LDIPKYIFWIEGAYALRSRIEFPPHTIKRYRKMYLLYPKPILRYRFYRDIAYPTGTEKHYDDGMGDLFFLDNIYTANEDFHI
jgi:hypothetical protein